MREITKDDIFNCVGDRYYFGVHGFASGQVGVGFITAQGSYYDGNYKFACVLRFNVGNGYTDKNPMSITEVLAEMLRYEWRIFCCDDHVEFFQRMGALAGYHGKRDGIPEHLLSPEPLPTPAEQDRMITLEL